MWCDVQSNSSDPEEDMQANPCFECDALLRVTEFDNVLKQSGEARMKIRRISYPSNSE